MGNCAFGPSVTAKFPWALAVPGERHKNRCEHDSHVMIISAGTKQLAHHADFDTHKQACTASGSNQTITEANWQKNV